MSFEIANYLCSDILSVIFSYSNKKSIWSFLNCSVKLRTYKCFMYDKNIYNYYGVRTTDFYSKLKHINNKNYKEFTYFIGITDN